MPVNIERKNKKTMTTETKIYETVAERLRKFREEFPVKTGWALNTEMSYSDNLVRCEARMVSQDGHIVATGHAEENRNGSFINETSAVENCETSAIGRCLFAAGFGGGEFTSADELLMALKKQEELTSAVNGVKNPVKASPSGGNGENKTVAQKTKESTDMDNLVSNLNLPKGEGVLYEKQENTVIAKGKTFSVRGLLKNKGFQWDRRLNAFVLHLS